MGSLHRYWAWVIGLGGASLLIALYVRSAAEGRGLICANAYRNSDEGSAVSSAAFSCGMKEMGNRDSATVFAIAAGLVVVLGIYLWLLDRRSKP